MQASRNDLHHKLTISSHATAIHFLFQTVPLFPLLGENTDETKSEHAIGIYPDRTLGGDRDYRDSDRAAVARRAKSPRSGSTHAVCE